MKQITILFLLLAGWTSAQDSANCSCCEAANDAFDFWVGDWIVYDTSGAEIGRNAIIEIQDNCALQESWTSNNSTGTSFNYYNPKDSTWNQLWIDNSGGHLVLKGQPIENGMVLRSDWFEGKFGAQYYNEIVWQLHPDGSVTQTWRLLGEKDSFSQTVFHGIYRKKEGED